MVSSVYSFSTVRWLEAHKKPVCAMAKHAAIGTATHNVRALLSDCLDADGSGALDIAKVNKAISCHTSSNKEKARLKELFARADPNRTGRVEFEVLVAIMSDENAFQLSDQQKQEQWRHVFSRFSNLHTRGSLLRQIDNDTGVCSGEERYAAFCRLFEAKTPFVGTRPNKCTNEAHKTDETLEPIPVQPRRRLASTKPTMGEKRRSLLAVLRTSRASGIIKRDKLWPAIASPSHPTKKAHDVSCPTQPSHQDTSQPDDVRARARLTVSAALKQLERGKPVRSSNNFTSCRPKAPPHPRLLGRAQSSRRGMRIKRQARQEATRCLGTALR
jgi:Ca2+-binding EF-hand superfamily protein